MKNKSLKRAIAVAFMSLVLCISMLVGTTLAWFTDSATSNGNVIKAGTLNVQLLMHDGNGYVDISDSDKPIFGEGGLIDEYEDVDMLWEPGKTQIVYLGVNNAGTLSLKYNILIDVEDKGLVGALDYAIVDGATSDDAATLSLNSWNDILAINGVQTGEIQTGRIVGAENGGLGAGACDYFALAVHMKETATDEYQDKSVEIKITIMATQKSSESDSFGDDYDANASINAGEGMMVKVGNRYFKDVESALSSVADGGEIEMLQGFNTQNAPIDEPIEIDKEVILKPNGMYLVSNADATFTVKEGGKLTIDEGSFTIKNTKANSPAVFVDGGEFEMAGGSFDAYAAIETASGKSSTVTLSAGWSNRVTKGIVSNGDDIINVTGGTLISSQESITTTGKTTINMSGGTLSGKPARVNQYNPSVKCSGETVLNMTGGKIETTANQSVAVNITENSQINLSGDAVIAGTFSAIRVGGFSTRDLGDNCDINISGNAKLTANGAGNNWKIGYAVQVNATNTAITVSGNAYIEGTSYGVYAGQDGCEVIISDNAHIKANSSCPDGICVGAPKITMTGGTLNGRTYGIIADMANSIVTIDNSVSGTPITISGGTYDVYVHATSTYTCAGTPDFDTFGERA